MRKNIFLLVFIIALLFFIFSSMDRELPLRVKMGLEGSTFKELQLIQKKEGHIKLVLNSKEAFLYGGGQLVELRDLAIQIPEREFKVFAKKGLYNLETGDFSLREMIEGISKNFKILAEEANWDSKNRILLSEKPIIIEGKRFTIEGNAGKANESLIELKKGVKAIVQTTK